MDENGIQLNGVGPFSVLSSTFDFAGSLVSNSTSTLFTLNGVTQSTITLTDVTYGNGGTGAQKYNYTIIGSSDGLKWTNQQYSGALAGDSHEQNDIGNHIIWQQGNSCQTVNSKATGPWNDPATWDAGFVPTMCNAVNVVLGTTVTLNTDAYASTTTIIGNLKASRVVSSTINV